MLLKKELPGSETKSQPIKKEPEEYFKANYESVPLDQVNPRSSLLRRSKSETENLLPKASPRGQSQNEEKSQGSYQGSKVAQNESSKKRNITPALDSKDDSQSRTKDRSSLDSALSKKRKLEDNKKDRRTSSGRDARKVKQTATRKGGKQVKTC